MLIFVFIYNEEYKIMRKKNGNKKNLIYIMLN